MKRAVGESPQRRCEFLSHVSRRYFHWPVHHRRKIIGLLESAGVRHVLAAHTHTTTPPISARNGLTVSTTGGTSVLLHPAFPRHWWAHPSGQDPFGAHAFKICGLNRRGVLEEEAVKLTAGLDGAHKAVAAILQRCNQDAS